MKLAWIVPKWPLPADDGARRATTQLISQLTKLGHEIHLCALVPESEVIHAEDAINQLGVKTVQIVRRRTPGAKLHIRNLLTRPWVAITLAPFGTSSMAEEIAAWKREIGSDAPVVYDGLHTAAWERYAQKADLPSHRVYRAHNVEADIWWRAAEQAKLLPKKLFLKLQAALMDRFERKLTRLSQQTFPVSDADTARFQVLVPGAKLCTLEIGLAAPVGALPATMSSKGEMPLLFIGRLDWPPNRDGLRWFLEKIWLKARERSKHPLTLTVVGSGDGSWLEKYKELPGLSVLGRVPEVDPHYAAAAATLVPVFYGSGTRVKAIEASLFRRVCISTEVGVEGIGLVPGKSYIRAESEEQWIEAVSKLSAEQVRDAGEAAFATVSERFDPKMIALRFAGSLAK